MPLLADVAVLSICGHYLCTVTGRFLFRFTKIRWLQPVFEFPVVGCASSRVCVGRTTSFRFLSCWVRYCILCVAMGVTRSVNSVVDTRHNHLSTNSPTHLRTHSLSHPPTHLATHLPTHSLTYQPTHSHTHSSLPMMARITTPRYSPWPKCPWHYCRTSPSPLAWNRCSDRPTHTLRRY